MRLRIPWTLIGYLAGLVMGGALASIIWSITEGRLTEFPGFYVTLLVIVASAVPFFLGAVEVDRENYRPR